MSTDLVPRFSIEPAPQSSDVATQTGLVEKDDRAQRIRKIQDVVMSVFWRVQELKKIYLYNYNRGIKLDEMGPHEAPLDYKLNQLDHDVTQLRDFLGI